jgi:hypothetical protein
MRRNSIGLLASLAIVLSCCGGAEDTPLLTGGGPDASVQDAATKDTGARADVTSDAPGVRDSGPMKSMVSCGMTSCTVPDQLCCRTGLFNAYMYTCQGQSDSCSGLKIPCDKAANCDSLGFPGQVCCAHITPQGVDSIADSVSCRPAGQCNLMNSSIILCDPKAPNSCPAGMMCTLSTGTIPGYYFCK